MLLFERPNSGSSFWKGKKGWPKNWEKKMINLKNKIALGTGASRGISRAIAIELAR